MLEPRNIALSPRRPDRRTAFTVVEVAMGTGLLLFVVAAFSALYIGQQGKAERIGQKTDLADQARSAYFQMTEEIKSGIDLMHPLIGSAPTPYLLFTNEKYQLIAYWVEKYKLENRENKEARRLMRMNFNTPGDQRTPEIVAPFVEKVQFLRKAGRSIQLEFGFRDADNNSLVLNSGVALRNTVAVY